MRILALLTMVLVGCGGTDPDIFDDSDSSGTGGGEDAVSSGNGSGGEDVSSSSGDTSSSTSPNTTTTTSQGSGGGCQPSVSCQSVGAECGTILDDGCGNEVECPDNCTGNLTCGGGGDQFKCGCTALTCLELGANCGTTDDGCGGTIECGSCGDDPYVSCGGEGAPNEFGQPGDPAQDNVCNGGCTKQQTAQANNCNNLGLPPRLYLCDNLDEIPPFPGCEMLSSEIVHENGEDTTKHWCCADQDL